MLLVHSDSLVTLNFESHPLKFLIGTCYSSKEKMEEMEGKEMEGSELRRTVEIEMINYCWLWPLTFHEKDVGGREVCNVEQ
jgi:hypothetical protein